MTPPTIGSTDTHHFQAKEQMLRERANAGLHDAVFKIVMESVQPGKSGGILDIGCGSGAWLNRFHGAGFNGLMGLDLDVKQFGLKGIPARAFNIDEYSGEVLGSFGLITALELIEHLENPGMLFRLVKNNLAPGGSLVISTPNIQGLPSRLRFLLRNRMNHFDNKSDPTHIYPVYLENLQRVLPRHGLAIRNVTFFPARGYNTYSRGTRLLSTISRFFLDDGVPGDNLIIWIQRT